MTVSQAAQALRQVGLKYVLSGDGSDVIDQLPASGAGMQEGSLVMLYVNSDQQADANVYARVPDVTGLSVVEANRLIRSHGLKMVVEGSGIAVLQMPVGGTEAVKTSTVTVIFEPPCDTQ